MTLELTKQQCQLILDEKPGQPIAMVDPHTLRTYVLITQEQFAKVQTSLETNIGQSAPAETISQQVAPGMLCSQQAFWRDLPELLKQKSLRGRWVCYHQSERVGTANTRTELVQIGLNRGLARSDFWCGRIEEHPTPPWEITEMDESLFEVET